MKLQSHGSPRPDGLAMTEGGSGTAMTIKVRGLARMKGRHCEERSDAAIHVLWLSLQALRGNPCRHEVMDRHDLRPRNDGPRSHGLPRNACNDGYQSHGSPRPDGLAMTEGGSGTAMTIKVRGLARMKGRHCEERSDAAIHVLWLSLQALRGNPCRHEVMDRHGLRPRNDGPRSHGLPRNACNDGPQSHGLARHDQ